MEHRVFGAPRPGLEYWDRPGAYGIAFDDRGRAAVVHCEGKGYFLLGGGIEPGEDEDACIRREVLEETGYTVTVGEKVCIGEQYAVMSSGRPFHPIGHIHLAQLGEKVAEPVETDHTLIWMPVEEFQGTAFAHYQAWAMEMAWELYQKRKKEKKS